MTLRQTAKMKLLPSVFSCLYSRVKMYFAMNSRTHFSSLCDLSKDYKKRKKNQRYSLPFAVCRKRHMYGKNYMYYFTEEDG